MSHPRPPCGRPVPVAPEPAIYLGRLSAVLLVGAVQGTVLALLLLQDTVNRAANRWLALLILAFVSLTVPYIIGYAGFYDRWPALSFAPFSYTLAFGPLVWLYALTLIGRAPARPWPHFVPVALQFLSQALVFPLPLAIKDHWDTVAHARVIAPACELGSLASLAIYGWSAHGAYRAYRDWLEENRADAVDVEPRWIRNVLVALLVIAGVWAGFLIANALDPRRNYFDQFWLYVAFCSLVLYLGLEGWRHAEVRFPRFTPPAPAAPPEAPAPGPPDPPRDWPAMAGAWLAVIDRDALWRDPDVTLASLARKLGTNTAYLSRALNAGTGENLNAVINRRRVAALQQRLADPAETRDLLTLALEAGFGSKASLNRAFAEFTGKPPSAWRAGARLRS